MPVVGLHRRGRQPDRGSVLALVPAGFLVLILLAAIAVDSAVTYLGQQQLRDSLAAAANDAVTIGINGGSFYGQGQVSLDPAAVAQSVCLDLAAQSQPGLHDVRVWMRLTKDSVQLTGTAEVNAVFGQVIPGFGRRQVRAAAGAVVTNGPLPPNASTSSSLTPSAVPVSCPDL